MIPTNFSDLYKKLGPGFGLVKAMQFTLAQIEKVRQEVVDAAEQQNKITAQMHDLNSFYEDERWDKVGNLKENGRMEEARNVSNAIRKDHNLNP